MHETLRELKASRMQDKIPLQKQSTLLKFAGEVKDKVLIFADHREQASKVVRKLHGMGALVKVKSLDVGDFILTDEIVVERKTVEDFLQSIIDGRLFQQLVRMATNFEKPLMLLEGNPSELFTARNIHKNAILGALTSITLNYRVPILFSANADETAEFLFVTAKREQLGKEKDIKLRIGRKGLTLREQQQFIIESLPLVGPSLARALLEQFGSVKKIFNASEKRLQKVEKIGEKKAREIRKAIETEWKKEEGN